MRRPRALAAALACLLATTPAMAQPKSNRPPQDIANELVKQAITKSQAGDHLGAIDLYLNAYTLLPQHLLLSNVGAEYQLAGKPIEALKYFCMYLEKDPTGTNATYALSKAKALQIELGTKNVDDKTACKPIAKPDKKPDKPPPPDDDPTIDTTEVVTKPPPPPPPKPKKSGGSGGGLKIAGIGGVVLGLAGVGAGFYFGRKAQEKSDLITNHPKNDPWPDDIHTIEADGQRYEDRQIQMTVAGSALVIVGGVLYVIGATRGGGSPEKVSVRPTASKETLGLAIGGGF